MDYKAVAQQDDGRAEGRCAINVLGASVCTGHLHQAHLVFVVSYVGRPSATFGRLQSTAIKATELCCKETSLCCGPVVMLQKVLLFR
jgi:hypothetical protein